MKRPPEEEEELLEKGSGEHQSVLIARCSCATHPRLCYRLSDTNHKALLHSDLGIWSTMIICTSFFWLVLLILIGHRRLDMQPLITHLGVYKLNNGPLSRHWRNIKMLSHSQPLPLRQPMNYYLWNLSKTTHPDILTPALVPTLTLPCPENAQSQHPSPSSSIILQCIQNLTLGLKALITVLETLTTITSASSWVISLIVGLLEFTIWFLMLRFLQTGRNWWMPALGWIGPLRHFYCNLHRRM